MRIRLPLAGLAALGLLFGLAKCADQKTVLEFPAADENVEVAGEDVVSTEGAQGIALPAAIEPRAIATAPVVFSTGFGTNREQFGGEGTSQPAEDGADPGAVRGPDSFTVGPRDEVFVLDSWKSRVARVSSTGEFLQEFALEGTVVGDIAASEDGRLFILSLAADPEVLEYTTDGTLLRREQVPLTESAAPMRIVAGSDGLPYVELSDGRVIVGLGPAAPEEGDPAAGDEVPGLPVGDDQFAAAVLVDDDLAAVRLFDPAGELVREVLLSSAYAPIGSVSLLTITDAGLLMVAVDRFQEDAENVRQAAETLVVLVDPEQGVVGRVSVPLNDGRESLRGVHLARNGGVWQLHLTEPVARLVRWDLR